MRQPIDLVGGFYTDESLPWSCQDTVNYLPVAAEASGTRTPAKLVDAPGLRPWVEIHGAGASRGLHDVEGRLFIVAGRTLYEISSKGVAIPRGTIPGVGRVSMAHNQRGHGHELLVVNGSGGYVYNTGDDTFTVVTDPGFPGAGIADFLDGYLMQVEPFGRFLFHSDLADALEYNTLDRFEAETAPDRVVGMIVNHQEVWAFGDRTIDVFANAGTAQGTFQNKGVSISRGCAAKWSPAIIDNGVAWLGDDRVVYHARGYDPVRISTRAIETALSEHSLADIRNAFSFVWSDRGHSVYYLTIPNGQTFGYDFSTGLWHRRASWHPEWDVGGRWRLSDLVRSNGRWIGSDYRDGRLYVLDWDYMLEGCDPLIRERVSLVTHDDGRKFTVNGIDLVYDTGGPESVCVPFPVQPVGPDISGDAPSSQELGPYSYAYDITQGDAPISSVGLVRGNLPDGLQLDRLGILSGTLSRRGKFSFTIRVVDANGLYSEIEDFINVGVGYVWYAKSAVESVVNPTSNDLTLGGAKYPGNDGVTADFGLARVGWIQGDFLTEAEREFLFNFGESLKFDELEQSADPLATSILGKVTSWWELSPSDVGADELGENALSVLDGTGAPASLPTIDGIRGSTDPAIHIDRPNAGGVAGPRLVAASNQSQQPASKMCAFGWINRAFYNAETVISKWDATGWIGSSYKLGAAGGSAAPGSLTWQTRGPGAGYASATVLSNEEGNVPVGDWVFLVGWREQDGFLHLEARAMTYD